MTISNISVSIIMSVYNGESSLKSAIESVLHQSLTDFEFLIVDDNSEDNSFDIISSYADKDPRVKVFRNNENLGLTKSLNFLILESKGKYIARQDADDTSLRDRLKVQYIFLERNNYIACSTRAFIQNKNRKIPRMSNYLPINFVALFKNPIIHGTLMIEKKSLNLLGNYNENFYYAQDYKLIDTLLKAGMKLKRLNSTLYVLNMENNISTNFKEEQDYFANCVRKNIIPSFKT